MGIVASTAALAVLLGRHWRHDPHFVDARAGRIAHLGSHRRAGTVADDGLRAHPAVTACPGCGRTTSTFFQHLAKTVQEHARTDALLKITNPGAENLTLAVMGCIVNGLGESRHANIGISLP